MKKILINYHQTRGNSPVDTLLPSSTCSIDHVRPLYSFYPQSSSIEIAKLDVENIPADETLVCYVKRRSRGRVDPKTSRVDVERRFIVSTVTRIHPPLHVVHPIELFIRRFGKTNIFRSKSRQMRANLDHRLAKPTTRVLHHPFLSATTLSHG